MRSRWPARSATIRYNRIAHWKRKEIFVIWLYPIHTADDDATQLSSWVASAVCIEFATSWRQSRRVWTICRQRSRVASCRRCERTSRRQSWPSFQFSAPVTYRLQNCKLRHDSRRVCAYHRHNSTRQDKFSTCSVSKFSSTVVGKRRELVANSIHTADATLTQLNSTVESRRRRRCTELQCRTDGRTDGVNA